MNPIPKLFIFSLFFVSGATTGAETITEYAYQAAIEADAKATWYQANVPASVMLGAVYSDMRDLRVFNAEGDSLPFALTDTATQTTTDKRTVTARIFPLYDDKAAVSGVSLDSGLRIRRNTNGDVEIKTETVSRATTRPGQKVLRGWLLDASMADFPLQRLILDWGGNKGDDKEGFFRIKVEASDDLEKWRSFGEGQLVNLSFDGQIIRQREFSLAGGKPRYLRLLFDDAKAAIGLRGAQLSGAVTSVGAAPLVWTRPLNGEVVLGEEPEYIWHLPVSLPLQKIRITLDSANVLAPVIVYGRYVQPATGNAREAIPPAQESYRNRMRLRDVIKGRSAKRKSPPPAASQAYWQTLASGVIYWLPGTHNERVENEFDLPGIPVNQLRIQVDRRGSGFGGTAPRIELALKRQELTFMARGSPPYRLAVGRTGAQAVDLPLAILIPGEGARARAKNELADARIQEIDVHFGPASESALATDTAAQAAETEFDMNKMLLWGVLILCVLLMAGMVLNLLRTRDKDAKTHG